MTFKERVQHARQEPARTFPQYATMVFALGVVFAIPDSAYMGRLALLIAQPLLIIFLYVGIRKVPKLAAQRILAVLLITVCIWSAPFLRRGGYLLTYIVIAEMSLLFSETFGYVTILASSPVMWVLSPVLNMMLIFREFDYYMSSVYVLFAGILFMVFTSQSTKLQRTNDQLGRSVDTIESLTLSRERARMASEMHDSLGQQLSAIHCPRIGAERADTSRNLRTARHTIGAARSISARQRTPDQAIR